MKTNVKAKTSITTHEGGKATPSSAEQALRRSVLTCLLWEKTFYEDGEEIASRIRRLAHTVSAPTLAALAVEARQSHHLRHVPLLLIRELARHERATGALVAETLGQVIRRADEPGEFLSLYWQEGRQPLAAGVKRGLATALTRFDAYELAKYDRDAQVKLRDVFFLCHPKPRDADQEATWKALIDGSLPPPDTWEVALSAGADKRATWERLVKEDKLGGLAFLRNLRNMQQAGVDEGAIRAYLARAAAREGGGPFRRTFPYRFVVAAKHAPRLEDALEVAMLAGVAHRPRLPGRTVLLVDVSGSMDYALGKESHWWSDRAGAQETSRLDVACGLAILLRETAESCAVLTFSNRLAEVPPRRGFALRDAIAGSQGHEGTYLAAALGGIKGSPVGFDRLIVITDEQSHDGVIPAWLPHSYVVNVAPYEHGVSYRNGYTHVDGWSEAVLDYVRLIEEA